MSTQNGSTTCEKCGGKVNTITSWCTPCNAELFEKEFPTWTSGIAEVDEFLRNTQITAERCESVFVWVDPSEFTQLEKVEYSKNNMAYWKEGHLLGWDLKSNKKIQYGGQWVKLVTNYCGEKHLATKFLKSELEFSKNNPSERLVYGITRDPITNYYAVIEKVVDKCSSCHNEWMSPRWCRGCNSGHFKLERSNWTSGNSEIDNYIFETQLTAEFPEQILEWIPETHFTNFKQIGKGGYGTVFMAYWKDGRIRKWDSNANKWERGDPMFVALKEIEKEDGGINEFLREAKAMTQCREVNLGSLDCYGITRHPETQSYLIVMRYVEHGNLRKYLSDFVTNPWKDRLDRLWSLSIDLRSIHRSNLVHRDLHAGNVLLGENKRSFIADLGLACDDGQATNGNIKGVLPYVAPEIFCGKPYTKATDIYSFAIIMWEFTSSQPPFYGMTYNFDLAMKICNGLRPPVIEGTPLCFAELMKKCWDPDPDKRPTAKDLTNTLEKWVQILSKNQSIDDDDGNCDDIRNQFKQSDLKRRENPFPAVPLLNLDTCPLASRLLPTIPLRTIPHSYAGYQTTQYDLYVPDADDLSL